MVGQMANVKSQNGKEQMASVTENVINCGVYRVILVTCATLDLTL